MIAMSKTRFLASVLAAAALVLEPTVAAAATTGDVSALQVLNTSALYADGTASYHACIVANVSLSKVNISVELIDLRGGVIVSSGPALFALAPGTMYEMIDSGGSLARCRVSLTESPALIRANLSVFLLSNGAYQMSATSEAR